MRFVIDTDVFVAAVRSPTGASAELLRRVRRGDGVLLTTTALLVEYETVATRSEHLLEAGASKADILNVIDVLAVVAKPVLVHYLWRPLVRDADDHIVLEAAINGRADMIVTFNRRDYLPAAARFGIEVLRPNEVLRRM